MIYIQKNAEPQEFIDWKRKFRNKNKRNAQYSDINGQPIKIKLKNALIQEQKSICCYCCNQIRDVDSHIEHFYPKGKTEYCGKSLDYDNLLASCQGEGTKESKTRRIRRHCGHAKLGQFDEKLLISPLDINCAERFVFSQYGRVKPKDESDEKARYTIDILNLNDEKLCAARVSALWEADVFSAKTKEEYLQLIEKYSSPASGKLTAFCDAILFHLRKGLEECD